MSSLQGGGHGTLATHVANSHDDTSAGSVHYYQDERGNWQTYCFVEKAPSGTDIGLSSADPSTSHTRLKLLPRDELGLFALSNDAVQGN